MKSGILEKLQCAARTNAVLPVCFDEAGFAASRRRCKERGHGVSFLIASNLASIAGAL